MVTQELTLYPARRALAWPLALAGCAVLLVLAVFAGPVWLTEVPAGLVLPVGAVLDGWITWFARDAQIGGVAVQDITRSVAALFDAPIRWAVIVLANGIDAGRGLNRAQVVPPLSWLALGGAVALVAQRLGGRKLLFSK